MAPNFFSHQSWYEEKNAEFYADSKFAEMGPENVLEKSYMQKTMRVSSSDFSLFSFDFLHFFLCFLQRI
jgi:hypothetical protein